MNLLIPKIEHITDPKHVKFAHQLGCVICGAPEVHFHHLRRAKSRRGQYRSGDNDGLPLCPRHHNYGEGSLHDSEKLGIAEPEYFAMHGINDPYGLARDIHANTGDYEACTHLIQQARTVPRRAST